MPAMLAIPAGPAATASPGSGASRHTRRGLPRLAGIVALAMGAGSTVACDPARRPPLFGGSKVVHVATFVGQDRQVFTGSERSAVELQRAANVINQKGLGFEIRVDFMLHPPRPAAGPGGQAPSVPQEGATPVPTPTPFVPTAITLEQALTGGELAGGAPSPDLVLLTSMFELPALLERKLIDPVEEVVKADRSFSLEDFAPGVLEAVRTRGKVAVLPLAGQVTCLLYDAHLFDSGGVARPDRNWTWTDLVEAGRRLTTPTGAGGVPQWGIYAHNNIQLLLAMIWSHGGELVSKDGRRSLLGDPAARQGIELWTDLLLRHRIAPQPPPGLNIGWSPSSTEIWINTYDPRQPGGLQPTGTRERLAMITSSSPPLTTSPFGTSGPRTIMPSPLPRGQQRATQVSVSAGLAMGARSQDQRLAIRAAVALYDHLVESPNVSFGYPLRKPDAAMLRRFESRMTDEDAEVMADAFSYCRGVPLELSSQYFSILNSKLMTPILSGRAAPDEAGREAAAALDGLLNP
ncbi:MAG TPA: extracellular solute-binding protein [Chloroflexota bacterium]|nr:extracellular solute-binding protein [Chloroflexota bacterium]